MIVDVSDASYYYNYILLFTFVFIIVQGLILVFRKKDELEYKADTPDSAMLEGGVRDYTYYLKGKELKKIYMLGFLLAKSAMWAKAPYTFILFSTLHKLNIGEIGVLYLIDAVFSLISGPFLGVLADTFGRKRMAMIYPMQTILVIMFRVTGNVPIAYFAQAITGFGGGILATCFESWLNYEMTKLYGDNKSYIDMFRKNIFSSVMFYDSILSLAVTIISAIIFNINGMITALMFSCCLAAGSVFVIIYYWTENRPNEGGRFNLFDSFGEGVKYLKQFEIFSLGVVDSIYNCSIQICIFVWTPILQITSNNTEVNVGMIFIIMILAFLIQNKCLEFLHKVLKANFFIMSTVYIIFYMISFLLIYLLDNFSARLILLAIVAGSGGFFNALVSYFKSVLLIEKHRTLLMNLFRIPLNVFLITMLILSKYFDPMFLCYVIAFILILPLASSIYLIYYYFTILRHKLK